MRTPHTPKNKTAGYTYQWKQERGRLMNYYNAAPYVGSEFGKRLYDTMKKVIPSIIQASVCGIIVSITVYKQDVDKGRHLLSAAFKKPIKETTCPYTEYVTLSLLNH